MNFLINYVKKEEFSQNNQFYVIAVFILYGKILDLSNFIEKIRESSILPISFLVCSIGENGLDSKEFLNLYNESKEKIENQDNKEDKPFRKNVIFRNFNEIYLNIKIIKQSLEVVFRPIQNGLFQEIANQVINN